MVEVALDGNRQPCPTEPARDQPGHAGMGDERGGHDVRAGLVQPVLKESVRQKI